MQYLTIPMTRGLNITDSAEGQGGYMVTRLENYTVLPGGGYRTVDGNIQVGSRLPGTGPIRAVWDSAGVVYAIRDDGADAKVYEYQADWVLHSTLTGAAGGTWELAKGNVSGNEAVYLVNGVTQAIVWRPNIQVFIATGMTPDTPSHVEIFKKRVWLSFDESVQYSAVGSNQTWTPVLGAGEILADDTVTAMRSLVGNTLGIWSKNRFFTITGTSEADFVVDNLNEYGNEMGAAAGSVQQLGNRTYFKGSRGIIDLQTAREFGDFNDATISQAVTELLQRAEENNRPYIYSTVSRNKNQYILCNDAGEGLILTLQGRQLVGWSSFYLGSASPRCLYTANPTDQEESVYAGDLFGDVYRIFDKTQKTFDGGPKTCSAEMIIPSFGQGNPRVEIHGATVNVRVQPVDFVWSPPTLLVKLMGGDLLPVEWDNKGVPIPIDYRNSIRPQQFYRGYVKTHSTHSFGELWLINQLSTDQPFVIDSVTIAFTLAGEDYQV